MLDVKQMEAFRTVVERGSVTTAALVLGVSQPAVSALVARLEEALGYALFTREHRRMVPTAEALALVGEVADLWFHCLVMLSHFDLNPADVIAELERREGLSGIEEKALRKSREREENGG